MTTIRTFVAVELPPDIKEKLAAIQADLHRLGHMDSVRWVHPESIHLTLKFLGNVPAAQIKAIGEALASACDGITPFTLTLTNLGCFPNPKRPNVIWVGVGGDLKTLQRLQEAVEAHIAPLGYPPEKRPFHPHLTLGRVKRAKPEERRHIGASVTSAELDIAGQIDVTAVSLMRSDLTPSGAKYTALRVVSLET